MILKIIGAVCIVLSSAGFGIMTIALHKKEVRCLKNLIFALQFMQCELQYRMPSLPELCRRTASECEGSLQKVFLGLTYELEDQISPDVNCCMNSVLSQAKDLPGHTSQCLALLGENLGRFDLQGQVLALESVQNECRERLNKLTGNADVRLRSYQTLGLCCGAAIVILLI